MWSMGRKTAHSCLLHTDSFGHIGEMTRLFVLQKYGRIAEVSGKSQGLSELGHGGMPSVVYPLNCLSFKRLSNDDLLSK